VPRLEKNNEAVSYHQAGRMSNSAIMLLAAGLIAGPAANRGLSSASFGLGNNGHGFGLSCIEFGR
jgi:hypothetical protein